MTQQEQRMRFRPKFKEFVRRPDAKEVAGLLRNYLDNTIKDPRPQEFSFWSVSCSPSTNETAGPRLFCVNIDRMETFVVGCLKEDPMVLWGFINVSFSAFKNLPSFLRKFPKAQVTEVGYAAAKSDCLQISMNGIKEIAAIISTPAVIRAAQLNGRLKPTIYNRFHNFDLVDYAYTGTAATTDDDDPVEAASATSKVIAAMLTDPQVRADEVQLAAMEGRHYLAEAKFRRRNRALIEEKKRHSDGKCSVCSFDFKTAYKGLECDLLVGHHVEPIGKRRKASKTTLDDIDVLCPNCHAAVHSQDPPLSAAELRSRLIS